MPVDFQLNVPQQVFTLFYAITWGTAANSQPRWKGFAWGAFRDRQTGTGWRLVLSIIVLNVLPLIYFAFILCCLGYGAWTNASQWDFNAGWKILLSTVPALAPFGFYRIWIACVEFSPGCFYGAGLTRAACRNWQAGTQLPPAWRRIGIEIKPESDLNPDWAFGNLLGGVIYVILGLIVALLLKYL
jgi:hypothetical protein